MAENLSLPGGGNLTPPGPPSPKRRGGEEAPSHLSPPAPLPEAGRGEIGSEPFGVSSLPPLSDLPPSPLRRGGAGEGEVAPAGGGEVLPPLRPRDLALLLLAGDDLLPRQRARDQQADRAGMALKRQFLDRLAAHDPEPEAMEAALMQLAAEAGPPSGPPLAVARLILEEWRMAEAAPAWVEHLLATATERSNRPCP